MRALVVDDELNIRRTLAVALESMGYEATTAATGADALGELKARRFDVMLLDHMLPGRSGIEVAKTLRASGNATPILMLTARDAPEDRRAAFAAGANEFMGKPFLFDDLLERFAKLIAA